MARMHFGSFELDPSQRTLCDAGRPVDLGARAFDMLLVLVEHHGRLVTKATLLERVWPKVIVDENNIPTQIAGLRRVLGPGAIRTVPGFGYRFELALTTPVPQGESTPDRLIDAPATTPLPSRELPARLGSLVGRDSDLDDILQALARDSLATVVGISGVGKSRLAREIMARAAEKNEVAAWVSLAAIEDGRLIPSAIARSLGLSLPDGMDGFFALHQALSKSPALLVLDGAEHLVEWLAAPLAELVLQTPGVRALVTSQTPMGIAGETVVRLSTLAVPPAGTAPTAAAGFAAIALFAQRASAADRRFELSASNTPIVIDICRRLDGIPLAIELAAARVPSLGLAMVLERLDDRFRLLKLSGRQSDTRHGALHAAFDWSYGLLSPAEQTAFDRLGTFAGSFSLHTAADCIARNDIDREEAIDLVGRLVDRSLVSALPVDPPRYVLLETARYYALGKLAAAGELQRARSGMAAAVLGLMDAAYQEYWSLDEAIWLDRHAPDIDNVRAALEWSLDQDREMGVALFGSSWPLFAELELFEEGRKRYSQVLALLSDTLPRARLGRFWEAIATYDSSRQCDRARFAAELAATMFAPTPDHRSHYYALMQLAFNWRIDTQAAWSAFDTAHQLEQAGWPPRLLTRGALTQGALLMGAGRFAEAREAYQRAVRLALTTSERQAFAATVNIVELDIACGKLAAALQLGRALAQTLKHSGRYETHFDLLVLIFSALLLANEVDEARAIGAELYDLARRFDTGKLYTTLDAMACLAVLDRRHEAAARILACADREHESHGLARRRPVEEKLRAAVIATLEKEFGAQWRLAPSDARHSVDESSACELALGMIA